MTQTTKAGSSPGLARHAWWVVLIAAISILTFATGRRVDRVEAMTNSPTWSVDAPRRDAGTATGYENGQRALIVPGHHNPSFWWIMEAQQCAAEGKWRLRHITYDSPPEGRHVGRTSPYRWWLIGVGWVRSVLMDEPLGYAIERGALYADPLLLVIMMTAGAIYVARFIGPAASIAFSAACACLFPLAANFQPGAPDPHSLAWALALGGVLPLFVATRGPGQGRAGHFALAGVIGGFGMWNDATSQGVVLLGLLVGGICREYFRSRSSKAAESEMLEWRAWAVAGSATTLVASLFEFAPGHLTFSLDAVSPVHAIVWWGAGELLHAAGVCFQKGRAGFKRPDLIAGCVACVAVVSWPAVGFVTGSGRLLASDFYAGELANHPRGVIAPDLGVWIGRSVEGGVVFATLLAPVVFLSLVCVRLWWGKVNPESRGRLALSAGAVVVALVTAWMQLRWWNLVDVLLLAAAANLFEGKSTTAAWKWIGGIGCGAALLPGLIVGLSGPSGVTDRSQLRPIENQAFIERDYASWLVKRRGAQPIVLYSTPIFSSAAAYYGGFGVVTSSDDGNKSGSLAAVRIAGATTEQEISVLVRSKGITHVALPLWDPILDHLVRLGLGVPADQPIPQNSFVYSLKLWDMPLWMRPMDYLIPGEERFRGFDLRSFSTSVAQEPEMALSRLVDLFLDRGQLREASAVKESLKAYPRSVPARAAVARVDLALGNREAVQADLEALEPEMSRRAARDLPVDRRISLGVLFYQTGRQDLAREQLTKALGGLDEETLKALTPGYIINLVAMTRGLGMSFPSHGLETLALELMPPKVRRDLEAK